MLPDIIGGIAATITTLCWLPQAVQIIRTREVSAVSALSYGAFAIGIAFWLVYGLMLGSVPITIANAITLVLVLVILGLKFFYTRNPPQA